MLVETGTDLKILFCVSIFVVSIDSFNLKDKAYIKFCLNNSSFLLTSSDIPL
jgi:hypothetical protein